MILNHSKTIRNVISLLYISVMVLLFIIIIITRTASHTTKCIHQRDSPLVRLLGGEGTIPKSTQYVKVVTDITQ